MDHQVAEEYKSSLNDLNFNSKPLINMLTMIAEENKRHAALIANTIVNHINKISPESKLPALYLVDSIMKNVGDLYLKIFCHQIASLFTSVFEKVDESTRSLMFKLRQTWAEILPNKILYNLDTAVKKLDPAWPVTAKNPSQTILINPKFLDGTSEEKSSSNVNTTTVKKEEEKLKQKQAEALKQLLAKQEQLRQLERKKMQQTMKKNVTSAGNSSCQRSASKHLSGRDPRMVKINKKSQNASLQKVCSTQRKVVPAVEPSSHTSIPRADDLSALPHLKIKSSEISKKESNKSNILSLENPDKKPVSQNTNQICDVQALSPKKVLDKIKSDKNNVVECAHFKNNINSNIAKPLHLENSCENNGKHNILKEDVKLTTKLKSSTPKKKNIVFTNCSKLAETEGNFSLENNYKKSSQYKFVKKNEITKSTHGATLAKTEAKSNLMIENKSIDTPSKSETKNVDQNVHNKQFDSCSINKSTDIRETASSKVPKREVEDSNKTNKEAENVEPPKKKIRNENIENLNPDLRKLDSPLLFGKEDQDLRKAVENPAVVDTVIELHPKYNVPSVKQENTSDPIQHKNITLPVQLDSIPIDVKQENVTVPPKQENVDRRWFGKQQFSDNRRYYSPEFDKLGFSRFHSRGRFNARFPGRRAHTSRYRGRSMRTPDIGQVMLNPSVLIEQAQEKYRSGKISENEYKNICFDLQKMLKSPEYQRFKSSMSKIQNVENNEIKIEANSARQENYKHSHPSLDNLRIQGPSVFLPPSKPFVLDGKKRLVYFIEDRAIALMDNDEPRELFFQNEPRNVFIDGVAEPIALGFDGKSAEFEIDGRRHIIRFGIPGREIFINNHPYEAFFGGRPIAAMLEDGCVYKIRLSGPPPQVLIGNKIEYDLFTQFHGNAKKPLFKNMSENVQESKLHVDVISVPNIAPAFKNITANNEESNLTPDLMSVPISALQDVDMRIKPENLQHSDVLLNRDSPFYSDIQDDIADMKDVDWRKIPPTISLEADKNFHENRVFDAKNSDSWTKEHKEKIQEIPYDDKIHQPAKISEEPSSYQWNSPKEPPISVMHVDEGEQGTAKYEMWHFKDDDKQNWREKEHRQNDFLGHQQHGQTYQVQNNLDQPFEDQIDRYSKLNRNHQPFLSHSRRPVFHARRMRGRFRGPYHGHWVQQTAIRPTRPNDAPEINVPAPSQTPLLPLPPFPPYSFFPISSHLPSILNSIPDVPAVKNERSLIDFQPQSTPPEFQQSEPPAFDMKVDVESLLDKLIAAGLINSKTEDEPISETAISESVDTDVKAANDASVDEIPIFDFSVESLKKLHNGVTSLLHKGFQCSSCGMRFKEMQSESYSLHLDWHFRMNRREKDGVKKAFSRRWYLEIEEWVQFEEFEDSEDRVPSYFEIEADNEPSEDVELPSVISVPATNNDDECCPVCRENFQLFWVEEEEEWHLRDAVRHDDVTYHPACYEDFMKASEIEKSVDHSKSSENCSEILSSEENEEIQTLLDELINNICNELASTLEISNEEELPDCSHNNEEVPSVEILSEEEILEGKPGEEEIIGVISDSEMEFEIDAPKIETKMVVMQSGGITLKVKAESLHTHSSSNRSSPCDKSFSSNCLEKDAKTSEEKTSENEDIDFRPPTPDPRFQIMPPISRGRELSGLCCIM